MKTGDLPFQVSWWLDQSQPEGSESGRHKAALALYLELAALALPEPIVDGFPARFDFTDAKNLRPDKGAIKTFLEHGIIEGRPLVGQLVFHLTEAGKTYRDGLETKTG